MDPAFPTDPQQCLLAGLGNISFPLVPALTVFVPWFISPHTRPQQWLRQWEQGVSVPGMFEIHRGDAPGAAAVLGRLVQTWRR